MKPSYTTTTPAVKGRQPRKRIVTNDDFFLPREIANKHGLVKAFVVTAFYLGEAVPPDVCSNITYRRILNDSLLFFRSPGLSASEAETVCRAKIKQSLAVYHPAFEECSWCSGETYGLHAHHYPVPKSKGGTETVRICSNCHSEFHLLVRDTFTLQPEITNILSQGYLREVAE